MRFLIFLTLIIFSALNQGCGEGDSISQRVYHSPIPMENMVLIETDPASSLGTITKTLEDYRSKGFNSICITLSPPYNKAELKTLIDSCHASGLNLVLHTNKASDVQTKWVTEFDVDGWHCSNTKSTPVSNWQRTVDSLITIKPVVLIADNATEELKEAGFASAHGNHFTQTVQDVVNKDLPVAILDSALRQELYFFTKYFPAIRGASDITVTDSSSLEAVMLATCAVPGVPYFTDQQLRSHDSFITELLKLYFDSPILQYGDCTAYDTGSQDIFGFVRDFKGGKMLIAINMHNRLSFYKWPMGFAGSKSEWVYGEKLARNNGQELPPFSFQILRFDHIVGIQPLEMDDK